MVTIKISQKHVERFVFIIIIFILLGLLLNEKIPGLLTEIKEKNNLLNEGSNLSSRNIVNENISSIKINETTINTVTTTSTSTTTTTKAKEEITSKEKLIVSLDDVLYEKINDNSVRINNFKITIKNLLNNDANIELRYYLYDETSPEIEKISPKRPFINIGTISSRNALVEQLFKIDRIVFNIDHEKTIKIEIEDLNSGTIETDIMKIKFN